MITREFCSNNIHCQLNMCQFSLQTCLVLYISINYLSLCYAVLYDTVVFVLSGAKVLLFNLASLDTTIIVLNIFSTWSYSRHKKKDSEHLTDTRQVE